MIVTAKSPDTKETAQNRGFLEKVTAPMRRFQTELEHEPELDSRILRKFPPAPELKHVTIRTDSASVDNAVCKALALAVMGIEARVELTTL